ncbi:MAG: methylmalonyl-CoA mutase small subunit [Prolixibacteraceae bacterium]|jgi:methylmalonyl-CoA mutase|nr:methylmalonyl-CoA mutase small subunit [Prolixibacteraceae bacterium]MBT6007149.1 methylmalonyl-CoA mutase small subunit [Prolixibacteraceae bacterium]MBT6765591.1 methylmalonyl-CoA mutase small subunit [Prolixibacteraceae bacterium]MBT6998933.1 methylmalonyl-CoA mutase small subunit [Prolixibacteraceae bacterium]MBT7393882.1 methylmalonyl-CoA mutase small subunit [Prolixibacteraceae bacterium]
MADKEQKLFNDFAPVTTEEWEAKINADLKGRDYERALVWKTYEGFNVRPYYREENLKNLNYLDTLPGKFPFVRGNKKNNNDWLVRQNIFVNDFEEANKKALDILGKGVTSLGFLFKDCNKITKQDLGVLLKDICLEAAEINLVCPTDSSNCAKLLAEFVSKGKWNNENVNASASIDPIGTFILKGKLDKNAISRLKPAIEKTKVIPQFRIIGVHGKFFANSGSSIVQELAFSLAQGVEYLTQLTEAGLSIDQVANSIKFNFGISNNYFMEIAKLRAARLLWAQIVKAYIPKSDDSAKLIAHCETNRFNKTIYDPYVNMLRTQTEAMSTALGGAHSITVLPFDAIYEETTEFSERIARNQQSLLKEESYFNKIVDPSAGSYYIENLTDSLVDKAWALFLTVQEKGGFISAFREGFVQTEIKKMAAKRDKNIAMRRENLLGTNQFPNFTEKMETEFDGSLFEAIDLSAEDAQIETLKPYRGAQAFEALRYTTDVYSKENKRSIVFMLTIGNLNFRKARAQFSCNFFAVAGFTAIDNNGFANVEEGVSAAKSAGADIIVVCSSDDEYAEIVPAVAEQLDDEILVVAGAPACADELKAKGITNFIHVKSNILEELKSYQTKLGI